MKKNKENHPTEYWAGVRIEDCINVGNGPGFMVTINGDVTNTADEFPNLCADLKLLFRYLLENQPAATETGLLYTASEAAAKHDNSAVISSLTKIPKSFWENSSKIEAVCKISERVWNFVEPHLHVMSA